MGGRRTRQGFRRILHPTDFSPASRPALAQALALARAHRAELRLVHVLTPPSPFAGADEVPAASYDQLLATARRAAARRLGTAKARAARSGARVRAALLEGAPAEEIARAARRAGADLIVIGTHGRTGLSRLFLGSVAERVLQLATCPVLSVRTR